MHGGIFFNPPDKIETTNYSYVIIFYFTFSFFILKKKIPCRQSFLFFKITCPYEARNIIKGYDYTFTMKVVASSYKNQACNITNLQHCVCFHKYTYTCLGYRLYSRRNNSSKRKERNGPSLSDLSYVLVYRLVAIFYPLSNPSQP